MSYIKNCISSLWTPLVRLNIVMLLFVGLAAGAGIALMGVENFLQDGIFTPLLALMAVTAVVYTLVAGTVEGASDQVTVEAAADEDNTQQHPNVNRLKI